MKGARRRARKPWKAPKRLSPDDLLPGPARELVEGTLARIRGVGAGRAQVTYAIGDVHGRWAAFAALLEAVADHSAGRTTRIVTLGDYVDKGPSGARVLETLRIALATLPEGSLVTLRGNHEAYMEDAIDGLESGHGAWTDREDRGGATLRSYGLPWSRKRLAELPSEHVAMLRAMVDRHDDGFRHYVHAGFRPGIPPRDQSRQDMLNIKHAFLDVDHDFGLHVVHGHTSVSTRPHGTAHRTGLDTRCGSGGRLTAAAFEGSGRGPDTFLSVDCDGRGLQVEAARNPPNGRDADIMGPRIRDAV